MRAAIDAMLSAQQYGARRQHADRPGTAHDLVTRLNLKLLEKVPRPVDFTVSNKVGASQRPPARAVLA
jgi:hypothetical protein